MTPELGKITPIQDDLIARFIAHAHATPEHIAIMTTDTTLTYQQLYQEVVYWQTVLQTMRGHALIICLERSPLLLTLFLTMQWLGIPYIPVDLAIPIERLRTILTDSQAHAILYAASHRPDIAALPCQVLDVEQLKNQDLSDLPPSEPYQPRQTGLSYIIYTSGSTGKPKGVAISRLALHNFLTSMSTYFLQEEESIGLAISSVSFDSSVLDVYLPLWQQRTVFIANQAQHKDPFSIADILSRYPITCMFATPSFWNMLLNLTWQPRKNLTAICGGEPLLPILAQRILTKATALWNQYGPTEATVCCTSHQILPNHPITVGRPILNMEMRVMDAHMRVLPPNTQGELFIGGVGLAEGYVNNPELTHAKFIPCADTLTGRLYRTGDLAYTTDTGEFVIVGRMDNQIKLHGYRIELEEIEAQIYTYPEIQEAAVIAHHEQLIAYLCLAHPHTFSESKFQHHLAQHLPEYMIPKRLVFLETLPKTVSGKIDRKTLPPPGIQASISNTHFSPTQAALAQIWSEELKLDTVGLHANFFELGGHSLSAARILVKIAQQLHKKVTLNELYQALTIAQLAECVEHAPPAEQAIPTRTRYVHKLPLDDFQLMLWLIKFSEATLKTSNIVWRRRVQGPLHKATLDAALQLVLQKQEIFSYHIHYFYPLQTSCRGPSPRFRQWFETSLLDLPETEVEAYLAKQYDDLFYKKTWRPNRPWIHAQLYYLQHEEIEIQVCLSHLITDENSSTIFFQELSKAYLFFSQHATTYPHDTYQTYQHYITYRHALFQQQARANAMFWTDYLQDAGSFHFPKQYILHDREPTATQISLSDTFVQKLRQFCIQHHVTFNDVLCAAISLALLQTCENDSQCVPHKLVISTTRSTRDDTYYDHTIGCFLRIEPIKLALDCQSTLLNLAKQAQQSSLDTATHQHASSLVKLAAIGKLQLCLTKKPIKKFVVNAALTLLAKCFPELHLDKSIFKACELMAVMDRTKQFLINMNITNEFLQAPSERNHAMLFGLPEHPIPYHHQHMRVVKYLLDVLFHRDHHSNTCYLVITANLTPYFQKKFGETLASIIEHCA